MSQAIADAVTLNVMVLVKASPVLTSNLEEAVCVAAMTLGDDPEWIRLFPVPFRDLHDESKFRKYQEVSLRAIRPRSDRRPESWRPLEGSIRLGETIGTQHGWSIRRQRVNRLGEHTMCELRRANRAGSGANARSLAVVRAAEPPELLITRRNAKKLGRWRARAAAVAAQRSLFDDAGATRPVLEAIAWEFRYRYRCLASDCKGHRQTIVDWEAAAFYRNVQQRHDWQQLMRQKYVDELWAPNRESVLFVGNMEQRPRNFLILGVFWPPAASLQASLLEQ